MMIAAMVVAPMPAAMATSSSGVTTINGTRVTWGPEWSENMDMISSEMVVADGPGVTALSIDVGAGLSLDDAFDRVATGFAKDSTEVDSGRTQDGGAYGLWSRNTGTYVMARSLYAPGSETVVVTVAFIDAARLDQGLLALRTFMINDLPAWDGASESVIFMSFVSGTPSGIVFPPGAGSVAKSPTNPASAGSTVPGTLRPEDINAASLKSLNGKFAPGADAQSAMVDSFTSDQFAYTLEWDATWKTKDSWLFSDLAKGYDAVTVQAEMPAMGGVKVWVTNQSDFTIDDSVQYWTSPKYLNEFQPEGTRVLLAEGTRTSGAVVMVGPSPMGDAEPWVTVMEVSFIGGGLELETNLICPISHFSTIYANAQRGIAMDGDMIVGYFTAEEILAVLAG